MVTFKRNQPITTRAPRILVDAGLPPGQYKFSLTAIDAAGNASRPSLHIVQVLPEGGINIEIDRPRIDIPGISRIDPRTDPRFDPRVNPRIRGRRNPNNSFRDRLRRFLDRDNNP